ncbi:MULTISPECIES: DUF72 domain-containing protein [unclassified Cupriavidus]|uniref:DUF72 domain-containing protein n=1 Tax=unclassified Cupriavidus TaxID=2640874 RepID=UPI001C000C54|nr:MULTISPECIES: DUF72 domain-containing protein [unclassified Cupriavidus]MCA3192762.1 DUF72 domain-containing protein [Cupriavidus sp.]MCA3194963.1 DUF72 domain-containing protein [Cupriavidus sp.]MCA3203933.1 DUF72 domain-containing protein [Cupriavidus sp.]MCA3205692.1 DUF72 domain-containing protein [Cupriavidus sp.]MCA3233436.1 DUF72 domain-containing protein [Cupriavidus sp.]
MTDNLDLFGDAPASPDAPPRPASAGNPEKNQPVGKVVQPWTPDAALTALAGRLPPNLYFGTSSWSYPGWHGMVYDGQYTESLLSRKGLRACGEHPLLRAAGIDRGFYGPIPLADYLNYASQVPEGFRFLVKAPASVCDAWLRGPDGAGRLANAAFLDADIAIRDFIVPATGGLGQRCGPLLFQLSPLQSVADDGPAFFARLYAFLAALPPLDPTLTPHACYAVEMRDPALLTPRYIRLLRERGVRFCLAARDRLPPVARQAQAQALMDDGAPGPLVLRWMLREGRSYAMAEKAYMPFDKLVDPDDATRDAIADVVAATLRRGQPAYVIVSNNAEGCAPLSIARVAKAIADRLENVASAA